MTKIETIKYTQACIATSWSCPKNSFRKNENVIFETDKTFFEIATYGHNAVIRADSKIVDWCCAELSDIPASFIMDGDKLYAIEKKLRGYGKKLSGQHVYYLHLNPAVTVAKPRGFTFELYGKDRVSELYPDNRFNNALGDNDKGTELAIVARKNSDIAAIVAVDSYHRGLRQIGIDTLSQYRGKGLAKYLVKQMAVECERRDQVPIYATWNANIASTRTVLGAGFCPVWVAYYAEDV